VKNKVAAPFRVAEFDIMFNQGISKTGDMLELGVAAGIVKKSGAFYSYGETRLGQGRENAKEFLAQHPEIAQSIEARVRGESPSLGEPAVEAAIDGSIPDGPMPEGAIENEAISPGSINSGATD
jgi:recombination protein RecA